jgi:lipid-A-disaccharide synthase
MALRVFVTAAEVSGDRIAAEMIRALREIEPAVVVEGLGGPRMALAGAEIFQETTARAAMTFHAVRRVAEFRRLLRETGEYHRKHRTDLHVCVDSSGVNLRFARVAKRCGVPVLYYVAPQVWASRQGRVRTIRRYVDRLACILPFEEPYFRARGIDAHFVGHPLFDVLPADRQINSSVRDFGQSPRVGIVAGSRTAEVRANLPHLLDVAERIAGAFGGAQFVLPTTSATDEPVRQGVATLSPGVAERCRVQIDGFDEMIGQCDLCLVKSGTSTLHVAAWNVPMIVVYRVNPVLWHAAARWIVKTPKIALVNILAGNVDLVPEFVPWHGSNEPVARCAIELLSDPGKLADQKRNLAKLIEPLSKPGASRNTAMMAMELMKRKEG